MILATSIYPFGQDRATKRRATTSHKAMQVVVQGLVAVMVAMTAINLYKSMSMMLSNFNKPYDSRRYSYIGSDHPEKWTIDGLQPAALTPEETIHYKVNTPVGELEWSTILPRGDGYIRLGDPSNPRTFRLSLFKQLDCLNIIRKEMLFRHDHQETPPSRRAHHCLNYLRQTITCHADSHLEMVRSEYGGRAVLPYTTRTTCMDWETIWREAERNFDEWGGLAGHSSTSSAVPSRR